MTATSPARTGRPFGRYRLVRELGRGGMGTVHLAEVLADAPADEPHRAEDPTHEIPADLLALAPGAQVAIKTFHPHLVSTRDFSRRFRREARTGAAIRHQHVVRTLDAGTALLDGQPTNYLVMEYVEGQSLRDLIREMGRLPEVLAVTIARQAAAGLVAIHRTGITHRDLKPENVILTRDHQVKLMDLGVAKIREESIRLSLTGQFLGSVHYASPEQFRAPETVDARTDLYALGVLLHEMLTGENPFFHEDLRVVLRKTLSEVPRRISATVEGVSPFVDQLARSLVEKTPADRPATAEQTLEVLERGEESDWWRETGRRLWSQSAGRVVRRLSVAREAPLVGRDEDLRALRQQFDLATADAGARRRVVLVEGEAGIGKTRLLDEFASSLAEQGARFQFLFGVAPAGGTGRRFHALSEALLQAIGSDDAAAALVALLPPGSQVAEFADLVTGGSGAGLPSDRALALFSAAFKALAVREPLVLVVDDLHAAGEESAQLLGYLAHDDPSTPLLLVAAYRPLDEAHALHAALRGAHETNVVHLPLRRLDTREVGQLLRHVLKSERSVQELGFRLLETTEGNPFYVLEVLRTLQEHHVLRRRDDGGWTIRHTRIDIHVPESVRELVQAQLARLDEEERETLDVAAVAGTEFDPELVAEVLGQPKIALLRRLSVLERRHRIIRAVGRRCRFDHPQLRDTLYESLMEGLREEYHAQVAEALLRRVSASKAASDGAGQLELLRHFVLGARPERAANHVLHGLRHAASAYEAEQGAMLAGRYLELAGTSGDPCLLAEVRLLLARFVEHQGNRTDERSLLERAQADAEACGDDDLVRRCLERRLLLAFATGDFECAESISRDSLRRAARLKQRDAAAAALANLAAALRCRGRFDAAAAALRRALRFVLAPDASASRATVLAALAGVEVHRGKRRTAQRHFLEAVAIAKDFGIDAAGDLSASRHPEHDELRDRFRGLSRALGRSAEARVDGERTILLGKEHAPRLRESGALAALAAVATQLGMHDDARGLLGGALRAAREAGDPRVEAGLLHALGENALDSRAPEMARKWLTEALGLRRRIGHRPGVCETLLALGQLAALGGSVDAARPCLEEAAELAPDLEMPAIAALALATSALLHAREGRPDRARADLDQARTALAAPGPLSISSRVEGLWFAALAARTLGDEDGARQHLVRAWEALRDASAGLRPEERRAFLLETSPHREIVEALRIDV